MNKWIKSLEPGEEIDQKQVQSSLTVDRSLTPPPPQPPTTPRSNLLPSSPPSISSHDDNRPSQVERPSALGQWKPTSSVRRPSRTPDYPRSLKERQISPEQLNSPPFELLGSTRTLSETKRREKNKRSSPNPNPTVPWGSTSVAFAMSASKKEKLRKLIAERDRLEKLQNQRQLQQQGGRHISEVKQKTVMPRYTRKKRQTILPQDWNSQLRGNKGTNIGAHVGRAVDKAESTYQEQKRRDQYAGAPAWFTGVEEAEGDNSERGKEREQDRKNQRDDFYSSADLRQDGRDFNNSSKKSKKRRSPTKQSPLQKQNSEDGRERQIRQKLRAQAYGPNGVNWNKLFHFYDRDNSGALQFNEFKNAVRKDGKMNQQLLSDRGLQFLFDRVDKDKGGTIEIAEFIRWLGGTDTNSKTSTSSPSPSSKARRAREYDDANRARIRKQRVASDEITKRREEIELQKQRHKKVQDANVDLHEELRILNTKVQDMQRRNTKTQSSQQQPQQQQPPQQPPPPPQQQQQQQQYKVSSSSSPRKTTVSRGVMHDSLNVQRSATNNDTDQRPHFLQQNYSSELGEDIEDILQRARQYADSNHSNLNTKSINDVQMDMNSLAGNNFLKNKRPIHQRGNTNDVEMKRVALPAGWKSGKDPATDKIFYFNRELNLTSWTIPIATTDDGNELTETKTTLSSDLKFKICIYSSHSIVIETKR